MKRAVILFCLFVLPSSLLKANLPLIDPLTNNAFYLNLNREGMSLLAQEAKSKYLTDIRNKTMPGIHDQLDYDIRLDSSDIVYSLEFSSLKLSPESGFLQASVGIRNLHFHIQKLVAKKKIVFDLSTTCENLDIRIAQDGPPILLSADLLFHVDHEQLELKTENLHFSISDDHYDVNGPRRCTGLFGIGSLIRKIAHNVLMDSKDFIEDQIKSKVLAMMPELKSMIAQLAEQKMEISGKILPGMGSVQGVLKTSPFSISFDQQSMLLVFNVTAYKHGRIKLEKTSDKISFSPYAFGTMGINPLLMTEILQNIILAQQGTLEVTPDLVPGIDQLLNVDHLADIWPELAERRPQSDSLRLSMEWNEAPFFEFDPHQPVINAEIKNIHLKFSVEKQGAWVEFFTVPLKLRFQGMLELKDGVLGLSFKNARLIEFGGFWANEYTPNNPIFNKQIFAEEIAYFLSVLISAKDILHLNMPKVNFGNIKLSAQNIALSPPFIMTQIMGEKNKL